MCNGIVREPIAPKLYTIRVQNYFVCTRSNQETIICKRLFRIEVEYKYEIFTLIYKYLIAVIMPDFLYWRSLEIFHAFNDLQHIFVKICHIVIGQILIVYQIPLTTGVLARPAISLAWEINPFGMSEFISHEIQITTINRGSSKQTNHLMKSNTTIYSIIFISFLHMPVHIGINQTEDNSLITY